MKASLLAFVFGLSVVVGCAGAEDVGDEVEGPAETGETSQELQLAPGGGGISTSGGLSAWCQVRLDCVNKCNRDYSTDPTRAFCIKTFCPKCPSASVFSLAQ